MLNLIRLAQNSTAQPVVLANSYEFCPIYCTWISAPRLGIALVFSLSTVWLLFSLLVGAQLEENDIQEAHSAADEAWHWSKPRYSTSGRVQVS